MYIYNAIYYINDIQYICTEIIIVFDIVDYFEKCLSRENN